MVTIRDLIRWGASQFEKNSLFFGHGTDNALDEAAFLVAHELDLAPLIPPSFLDVHLTQVEKKAIIEIIRRRIKTRKPAAYLTGYTWFADLKFLVNEDVLVPRSPLAELIQNQFDPWIDSLKTKSVLDLCTGSACLGIACAVHFDSVEVLASDISAKALALAKRNVDLHNLNERLTLCESNLFENISEQKFDLIISNPPYVPESEWLSLPLEYKNEPKLGLSSGNKGMSLVGELLKQAANYLEDDGHLIVEVGYSEDILVKLCPEVPFTWIDFEHGGQGVFILSKLDLENHQEMLEECDFK